jgi:hypothetical protein
MKTCVISLNRVTEYAQREFFVSSDKRAKYFYEFTQMPVGMYTEDSLGAQEYIDTIYDDFDIFIEFPVSFSYDYMYQKDAETKFIYVNIDKALWIEKMQELQSLFPLSPQYCFEELFCNKYINTETKVIKNLTSSELSDIYDYHLEAVNLFFADKQNCLFLESDDAEILNKIDLFINN